MGVLLLFLHIADILFPFTACSQNLYEFVPDHCEVTNANKTLIDMKLGKCYKTSRTQMYFNLSFVLHVDILNDHLGQVKITGYQFRSNEYRKGPIEFMLGMCAAFNSKEFDIPNMLAHSNLKCPLTKGTHYYIHHLKANATNYPPFLPEGKWLLKLDFLFLNKYAIFTLDWYASVEYKIKVGEILRTH